MSVVRSLRRCGKLDSTMSEKTEKGEAYEDEDMMLLKMFSVEWLSAIENPRFKRLFEVAWETEGCAVVAGEEVEEGGWDMTKSSKAADSAESSASNRLRS